MKYFFLCAALPSVVLLLSPTDAHTQYKWITRSSGFSTPNSVPFTLAAVDSNIVWGASSNGTDPFDSSSAEFTRTTDGGATWSAGTVTDAVGVRSSCIAAIDANTAWNSMTDPFRGTNGGIFKTTDGGVNWSKQTTAYPGSGAYVNFVHFFDRNNGVTIGNPSGSQVTWFEGYTTTDGGTNWTRIPEESIPAAQFGEAGFDRCYAAVGNTVWFGTQHGRVYKSVDRGANWTATIADRSPNPFIHSLTFSDTSNGIATFYLGTYISKTTDGGLTWTSSPAPTNPSTAYITCVPGMSGVYVTTAPAGYDFNPGSAVTTDNASSWIVLDHLVHQRATFVTPTRGWSGGVNTNSTTGIFEWSLVTSVLQEGTVGGPHRFELAQNYPNPFNPSTTIQFSLPKASHVVLKVYNMLGEEITTLVSDERGAGTYTMHWNAAGSASGVYFYRIQAGSFTQTRKLLLLK